MPHVWLKRESMGSVCISERTKCWGGVGWSAGGAEKNHVNQVVWGVEELSVGECGMRARVRFAPQRAKVAVVAGRRAET